jgi:hypothetical protein
MAVLQSLARQIAKREGIDPSIFVALVNQESQFNLSARSPAGALGLTQLMPGTARSLGVRDPFDPVQNLRGGARYLKQQLESFGGDYRKALAAYNAGPGAVQKYGGIPPFEETQHYVSTILEHAGSTPRSSRSAFLGSTPNVGSQTVTRTIPGKSFAAERGAAVQSFLGGGRNDAQNNLDFALQIHSLQDVPSRTVENTQSPGTNPRLGSGVASGNQTSDSILQRADALNAQHLPYRWGGGHGSKPVNPYKAVPVDCSGAVASVLGIDPRVSGEFEKFGKPGVDPKGVTIYANGRHVLMSIAGHFFGTSASNPGGGAGWISKSQISPAYLKGFVARHL